MKQLELLAPAGSMEALVAAVESGADAVYIGGTKFNARAFANNLDQEMLRKAVEYAHIRNVRVYVTVNILILQNELVEVMEYIKYLYSINIDAVIVQDIGLALLIRRLIPDFEVHCSTQMAIHNSDGAMLLNELGIKRVVLARELTLKEIDKIVEDTGVDAEIFVHGALCICYSGQCYMSSLIGGRSGNRGTCAQPCRRKYSFVNEVGNKDAKANNDAYLISTRDLNTYEGLYDIAASKAASLKIEGRMKRPEYVAIIAHHYRKALDCILEGGSSCLTEQAAYELKIAFNREFTKGYMFGKRNQEIVSIERPDNRGLYVGKVIGQQGNMAELLLENNFLNDGDSIEIIAENGRSSGCTISGIKKGNDTVKSAYAGDRIRIFITDRVKPGSLVNKTVDNKLFKKALEEYAYTNKRKTYLHGRFLGRQNELPIFEVSDSNGNSIKVEGEELVQKAQKQAVNEEKVNEQLQKTKDTPYVFEKLEIDMEADSFLSIKAINSLRRDALDKLSDVRIRLNRPDIRELNVPKELSHINMGAASKERSATELVACVRDLGAGIKALEAGADAIYIIGSFRYHEDAKLILELSKHCLNKEISLYYLLPQITRDAEVIRLENMLRESKEMHGEFGLIISNISHIKLAERLEISRLRANFSMNITNCAAAGFLTQQGVQSIGLSPELNLSQIRELSQNISSGVEAIVYGYLPAMVTEYCPYTAAKGCDACSGCSKSYSIIDERNKQFRVIAMGNCRNTILNSDVLCLYDNLSNIVDSGVDRLRMDFYLETEQEVYNLVKAYKNKINNLQDNKAEEIIKKIKEKGYTKGHYFRGIE